MPASFFKTQRSFNGFLMGCLTLLALCLMNAATLPAAEKKLPSAPGEPISINADRLVSDTNQKTAEFLGNVKVVQGTTTITADRLKLAYKGDNADPTKAGAESIDTIEATGHVRIALDNRVAVGQKAVYTTSDRKLVISGPGAQITSGPDVIEGSTITFHRDSGKVEMVGQVKATIRSDQRGLN
jgi:lipopolysaccharide export system protein LptA